MEVVWAAIGGPSVGRGLLSVRRTRRRVSRGCWIRDRATFPSHHIPGRATCWTVRSPEALQFATSVLCISVVPQLNSSNLLPVLSPRHPDCVHFASVCCFGALTDDPTEQTTVRNNERITHRIVKTGPLGHPQKIKLKQTIQQDGTIAHGTSGRGHYMPRYTPAEE